MVQYSSSASSSGVYGELAVIENSDATVISGTDAWQEVTQMAEGHPLSGFTTVSGHILEPDQDGLYVVSYHVSATVETAARDFQFAVSQNETAMWHTIIERHFSTNTDIGAIAGTAVESLSAGDTLKLFVRNRDDSSDITIKFATLTVHKL